MFAGGGKSAESSFGRCGQVPLAAQVSAAENDLGRRRDHLLLQREIAGRSQGLLPPESLPDAGRKAHARQEDGTHANPSLQLVQEPAPERPHAATEIVSLIQLQ